MTLLTKIKKSRFHLLYEVIPIVFVAAGLKTMFHFAGWEFIPIELTDFFPSILTGIIFILGFLLAGVVSDYKESERIPNEIATSVYAIWREAKYLYSSQNSKEAAILIEKIKIFVTSLKMNFFIKEDKSIFGLLNQMYEDIVPLEKHISPPSIARLKNEHANIRKLLTRVGIIKKTSFIPSVFVSINAISLIFLLVYSLLIVNIWWVGVLLISIFTFVIFSIIFLIADMEDPFEYDESGNTKSDEVSLSVFDQLEEEMQQNE